MSFHWKWSWVQSYFYHFTRIKWKIKINDKNYIVVSLLSNKVFSTFFKIILVHLHKRMIMNQFHIHSLFFFLKSLKHKSTRHDFYNKWNLCFTTFDIICTFSFDSIYLHYTMQWVLWSFDNQKKPKSSSSHIFSVMYA
jgi:hypothetical protein